MARKQRKKAEYDEPRKDKLYRLDLTTIAKIDIYARIYDWANNTLVETSVIEKIDRMAQEKGLDWKLFAAYASDEGELLCAMFKATELLNSWTPREDAIRKFVRDHEVFFYDAHGKPNTWAIKFLWPSIDAYVRLWNTAQDAWSAWRAMSMELEKHNLPAPAAPARALPQAEKNMHEVND